MGELNTAEEKIDKVKGAAGQVKVSRGAGKSQAWGLPRWTLNKILKGTGVESNPEEIDVPETNPYTHPSVPACRVATAAQTGHATAAQISKLNGVEAQANKYVHPTAGACPQTPKAHKTTHQDGGADKINVAGLSGELVADQKSAWTKISGKPTSPSLEEMATEHQADGTHGAITPSSCTKKYTHPTTGTCPQAPKAHESTHVAGGSDDIDSALAIAAMANLANNKIWKGSASNRPTAVDMPGGWSPTGNGGTKVAGADCEAALKDPVASTKGLRSLGTGAQQAAAGNHTHTLVEDTVGEKVDQVSGPQDTNYVYKPTVPAKTEQDLSSITKTFATGARVVAVGVAQIAGGQDLGDTYFRLYMAGVMEAEENWGSYDNCCIVLVATKALTGSKICKICIYNDDIAEKWTEFPGTHQTGKPCQPIIAVGSIKV